MQSPAFEPMAMGSPTSPIMSSPTASQTAVQSPYLPAYLFGEPASAAQLPSSRMWSGATVSPQNLKSSRPGSHSTPINPQTTAPVFNVRHEARTRELGSRAKEKAGAPPVQSLADSFTTHTPDHRTDVNGDLSKHGVFSPGTPCTPALQTPGGANTSVFGTPVGQDTSYYTHARKTPPSPAQVDPFYTQGEDLGPCDDLDETWVTVFGFPPAATSFILQQFSQYGNILKHVIAPDGNWMHIHYQSKLQAKKALSKNSKIFCNSIMVGVTTCIDKSVMHGESQDPNSTLHKSCYLDAHTSQSNTSMHSGVTRKNTPMRPLTAAYQAVKSEHEVLQSGNTPQKSSNVVSKAMEYMFGW